MESQDNTHKSKQATGATQTGRQPKDARNISDFQAAKCNVVRQDAIWRQSLNGEKRALKTWQENWGFLAEYDERGELKELPSLPDYIATYSETFPNRASEQYGYRLDTKPGQIIQKLEFDFYADRRRKKLDDQMLCY